MCQCAFSVERECSKGSRGSVISFFRPSILNGLYVVYGSSDSESFVRLPYDWAALNWCVVHRVVQR